MSEMVDRVAGAIAAAAADLTKDGPADPKDVGSNITKLARDAIEAMREPTEAMIEAAPYDTLDFEPDTIWSAMIDEALK